MGFWVVENLTGAVKDYSADGSINYDPRFHTTRQDINLPSGDQPQQYRWDGTQIVKRPPPPPNPLKTLITTALVDATVPASIKAVLTEWRSQITP